MSAPTKPIYQFDERLRDHIAQVVAVTPVEKLSDAEQALFKTAPKDSHVLETRETIFYAQGGGQPSDTGYMTVKGEGAKERRFSVDAVRYGEGGRILHLVTGDGASLLEPGEMVEQHVNGDRRDLNSRCHTAGHVVALAVRRLVARTADLDVTELKASHYPDACFVEFKGLIDGKHKDAIQQQAAQFVKDGLPIRLSWYGPDELAEHEVIVAEGMPIVTGPDGKVRVVDIVGAGAYPCGGTHIPDTSFIGELTIKGIKRQKGISKVSYIVASAGT